MAVTPNEELWRGKTLIRKAERIEGNPITGKAKEDEKEVFNYLRHTHNQGSSRMWERAYNDIGQAKACVQNWLRLFHMGVINFSPGMGGLWLGK